MIAEKKITIRIGFSEDEKLTPLMIDKVFRAVFDCISSELDGNNIFHDAAQGVVGAEACVDFVVIPNNK